jgi:hypothetical protein
MENILFGIFQGASGLEIKKFKCNQQTQTWLITEFQLQLSNFLGSVREEKEFDAHGLKHNDELYWISDFSEKSVVTALLNTNADSYSEFSDTDFQRNKPKAVGMVVKHQGEKHICLQLFNQRNILDGQKKILKMNDHSLERNENYLISLNDNVIAVIVDSKLKFKSFFNVKQIFDLKSLYVELSNDQIEEVVDNIPHFTFQDKDRTLNKITLKTRKLFSALSLDTYVKNAPAKDLTKRVKKDTGIVLTIERGQICLPKDPQTLYVVLNSMLGKIYEDDRTQQMLIATSTEQFQRP